MGRTAEKRRVYTRPGRRRAAAVATSETAPSTSVCKLQLAEVAREPAAGVSSRRGGTGAPRWGYLWNGTRRGRLQAVPRRGSKGAGGAGSRRGGARMQLDGVRSHRVAG
nr:unnamed protein product [Digitaria exilis]